MDRLFARNSEIQFVPRDFGVAPAGRSVDERIAFASGTAVESTPEIDGLGVAAIRISQGSDSAVRRLLVKSSSAHHSIVVVQQCLPHGRCGRAS